MPLDKPHYIHNIHSAFSLNSYVPPVSTGRLFCPSDANAVVVEDDFVFGLVHLTV